MPWSRPGVLAATATDPEEVVGPTVTTCAACAEGTPTSVLPTVTSSAGPEAPTPGPPDDGDAEAVATASASPSSGGPGVGASGPALLVTVGSTLVGVPSAQAAHVVTVGPTTSSGSVAVAANTPGLLQGINYG